MRRMIGGKFLISQSAICLTEQNGRRFLTAVVAGDYTDSRILKKQIDDRTPPPVLLPYTVLCVARTSQAKEVLATKSKGMGLPILETPKPRIKKTRK